MDALTKIEEYNLISNSIMKNLYLKPERLCDKDKTVDWWNDFFRYLEATIPVEDYKKNRDFFMRKLSERIAEAEYYLEKHQEDVIGKDNGGDKIE